MANEVKNRVGIDTNVLVRYITQDDAVQSKIASDFLESLTTENQGFINNTVIVELIWVLSRSYKTPREQIAEILAELFHLPVFVFDNQKLLLDTLAIYQNSKADFSDLLICQSNHLSGCQYTVTFDKTAYEQAGMVALSNKEAK